MKRAEQKKRAEEKKLAKEKRRLANTCRAECGKTCITGPGWTGCEKCDIFWVCSECIKKPKFKRMLTFHEKKC